MPSMLFMILIYNKWTLLPPFCLISWMKLSMWSNLIISSKILKYITFTKHYIVLSSFLRYDIWPLWIFYTSLAFINQNQIIKSLFLRISLSFLLFMSMTFSFLIWISWDLTKSNINSPYNLKWQILMRYLII